MVLLSVFIYPRTFVGEKASVSATDTLARVYLVEDSYGDIVLTKAILKAERFFLNLFVFRDGVEVIAQLENCPEDERPDLVLLDFNLPKVSGVEVMEYMNENLWSDVPVLVITGSEAKTDRELMSSLGATCFLKKPLDLPQLISVVEPLPNINVLQRGQDWLLQRVE
jgi:CheY-like chemotaxis protein